MLAYGAPAARVFDEGSSCEGEAFFKEHPVPEAAMKLSQVLEKIRSSSLVEGWLCPRRIFA